MRRRRILEPPSYIILLYVKKKRPSVSFASITLYVKVRKEEARVWEERRDRGGGASMFI